MPPELKKQCTGRWLLYYIDDFSIGHQDPIICQKLFNHVLNQLDKLSLEIKQEKLVQPCQRIKLLGFNFDTTKQTVSLPDKKCHELSGLIDHHFEKTFYKNYWEKCNMLVLLFGLDFVFFVLLILR